MSPPVRVLDTGIAPARWNIAMTAALLELRKAGHIADTLRFHGYRPSVLLGRHQTAACEVRGDSCRRRGIEIARRVSGGGAVYMYEGVLAWDFVAEHGTLARSLEEATARIGHGIVSGLALLGIVGAWRPPSEVLVGGRKVSGGSGAFEGKVVLLQGTLIVGTDEAAMADALTAPVAGRTTSLETILGSAPPIEDVVQALAQGLAQSLDRRLIAGAVTAGERVRAARLLVEEIGTEEFVRGESTPGCMVLAS